MPAPMVRRYPAKDATRLSSAAMGGTTERAYGAATLTLTLAYGIYCMLYDIKLAHMANRAHARSASIWCLPLRSLLCKKSIRGLFANGIAWQSQQCLQNYTACNFEVHTPMERHCAPYHLDMIPCILLQVHADCICYIICDRADLLLRSVFAVPQRA